MRRGAGGASEYSAWQGRVVSNTLTFRIGGGPSMIVIFSSMLKNIP